MRRKTLKFIAARLVSSALFGYKTANADIAIIKDNGKYTIFNYQSRKATRVLSLAETVSELEKLKGEKTNRLENGERHAFVGTAEDGKKIYESNFPKGTPKEAKSKKILDYITNVWSKKPISLVITNGEKSRTILAHFDPTVDETHNTPTDASKIAGGNRHGNHTEQRVTLDLADDYYQIASDSTYNYSKEEEGKGSETHKDVKMWHYFVNDIYFLEHGESKLTPYKVTINVKEKSVGNFVYSFNAEKIEESTTRQTLHAAVNTRKGANGELFIDSIPEKSQKINPSDEKISKTESKTEKPKETTLSREYREAEEFAKKNIPEYNKLYEPVKRAIQRTIVEARSKGEGKSE